jgi:hypothetical protein
MKKNKVLFFTAVLTALALTGCPGNDPGESLTAPETPGGVTVTPPETPGGVTVTPDAGQLAVAWQAVEGAETYEVKWGEGTVNTKTGITGTGWLITGLTNDTAYSVQVRAKNATGESGWSEAVAGTPKAPDNPPAGKPGKPTVTASGDTLTVSWTAAAGATKYRVFYGTSASPATQYGSDITGTSVEFTVSGNGTWYVRIQAGNSRGFGEYSDDASVTVSGVVSVVGSWKSGYGSTYTFGENGKLIYTYNNNDGSTYTGYYFYDPAKKEWYRGQTSGYTLSGDSLDIYLDQSFSLTSDNHEGLTGTWTGTDGTTIEITANTITVGSDVYSYYTRPVPSGSSGGTTTYLSYCKPAGEPDGRYALSGGKLQLTEIDRTTYEREGAGSGLVGTWKHTWSDGGEQIWTFTDKTAEYKEVDDGEEDNKQNYPSYTVSGDKITLEQEVGTLSGDTLTVSGLSFTREGSGSGITGKWKGSFPGDGETTTITFTITADKLEYTQTRGEESDSGSWPIRIDGNSIYTTTEYGYKLDGDSLTIIREWTEELEPVK